MPNGPTKNPDQETRNDDPNVQEQREQRARGDKDQAEGDRTPAKSGDERINPEVTPEPKRQAAPRGDRKHGAREERRPGGGRRGMSADEVVGA